MGNYRLIGAGERRGEEVGKVRGSERPSIPPERRAFRRSKLSGEKFFKVRGGLIAFDDHFCFSVPMHPDLLQFDLGRFVRGVKDIVVGGVDLLCKLVGCEVTSQVV